MVISEKITTELSRMNQLCELLGERMPQVEATARVKTLG